MNEKQAKTKNRKWLQGLTKGHTASFFPNPLSFLSAAPCCDVVARDPSINSVIALVSQHRNHGCKAPHVLVHWPLEHSIRHFSCTAPNQTDCPQLSSFLILICLRPVIDLFCSIPLTFTSCILLLQDLINYLLNRTNLESYTCFL